MGPLNTDLSSSNIQLPRAADKAPFKQGENKSVPIEVIDTRGNIQTVYAQSVKPETSVLTKLFKGPSTVLVKVQGEVEPLYIRVSELAKAMGIKENEISKNLTDSKISNPTSVLVELIFQNTMNYVRNELGLQLTDDEMTIVKDIMGLQGCTTALKLFSENIDRKNEEKIELEAYVNGLEISPDERQTLIKLSENLQPAIFLQLLKECKSADDDITFKTLIKIADDVNKNGFPSIKDQSRYVHKKKGVSNAYILTPQKEIFLVRGKFASGGFKKLSDATELKNLETLARATIKNTKYDKKAVADAKEEVIILEKLHKLNVPNIVDNYTIKIKTKTKDGREKLVLLQTKYIGDGEKLHQNAFKGPTKCFHRFCENAWVHASSGLCPYGFQVAKSIAKGRKSPDLRFWSDEAYWSNL